MMPSSFRRRLLWRELGERSIYSSIAGIYGDKKWVDDLDIVNELGGHTGCVNALSWSKSGQLLASGSDDHHLNLYSYQPESTTAPFTLNTTVYTGHTANIFSVKFMPHSNDRTVVTCAGDAEVRVFDIERSGQSEATAGSVRSRRFNDFWHGMRHMSEANTNCRVYQSHADRVKRIVTESSPYLFLTCSEDGEVRQWDLRQPSSAYPPPRGGQGFMTYRPGLDHDDSNVPPPLISYKKYHIDLNSISCSPSQPQYIALGGAHLHCFLHDRRMLGRDIQEERGQTGSFSPRSLSHDDEDMGKATRCVRRFAPGGQRKMRSSDSGHITACKISNANPNEMIVSWSGDHIYSFDLIRSPDAEESQDKSRIVSPGRARRVRTRKRKRPDGNSSTTEQRPEARLRSDEGSALRVRYGNGESEDIPLDSVTPSEESQRTQVSAMNDGQRRAFHIAEGYVKIRKSLFSVNRDVVDRAHNNPDLLIDALIPALDEAAVYLPMMDDVIRSWTYPINPSPEQIQFHQTQRKNRESSRRFVQGAGALVRVVRGYRRDADEPFELVVPGPTENNRGELPNQFNYDFLKAILLWLEGGRPALLERFKSRSRQSHRFPIPESADESAVDNILVPYLESLAGEDRVIDVDASRFERDEARIVFDSTRTAVKEFARAIQHPIHPQPGVAVLPPDNDVPISQSHVRSLGRDACYYFWGMKVARGVLFAAETLDFETVNRAFGGVHMVVEEEADTGESERNQEDIDLEEDEAADLVTDMRLVRGGSEQRPLFGSESPLLGFGSESTVEDDDEEDEARDEGAEREEESDDDDESDEDEDEDEEVEDEDEDEVEDDDDEDGDEPAFYRTRPFVRHNSMNRIAAESHVPCSSHLNVYRGHCNIKTVKDVNYYGPNDEYVVSGSDCGHLFIWDRRTARLLNILEGDSDTVNVIEGHPYEPTVAVSGIDRTIKIFSADQRAQHDARMGINIADPDAQANILAGRRNREAVAAALRPTDATKSDSNDERRRDADIDADVEISDPDSEIEFSSTSSAAANEMVDHGVPGGLPSARRMGDSYQIMSENDANRRGGMEEALLTRTVLARIATTLRGRQANEEGGGPVPVESCTVM